MFDKYSSLRVEDFSIYLLDQIFAQFDLHDISYDNKRIISNKLKLYEIPNKIEKYLKLKHQGKYGNLDKDIQNKLNIKLLCSDLLEQSAKEKQKLVVKFVSEYDANKKAIDGITFEDSILKKLNYDLNAASRDLKNFLDRVGLLYNFQKNKLRRRITDDEKYKNVIAELDAIFNKHIGRAFKIFK